MVRLDHLGVCHAVGPYALPQGPQQEELVDQEGVYLVSGLVALGGNVFQPFV